MFISMILVFDLDDTLYEERSYVESGLRAVAAEMGLAALGPKNLTLARDKEPGLGALVSLKLWHAPAPFPSLAQPGAWRPRACWL